MQNQDPKPAVQEFIDVGHVSDAHGLKGELYIYLKVGKADWLDRMDRLYLGPSAMDLKEYSLLEARPHKQGLIVATPEIATRTQAEGLKGSRCFVPASWLVSGPGEDLFLKEIENFRVEFVGQGEIGTVVGFSSNGAQDLIEVKTKNGVVSVPFIKEFLVRIDFAKGLVVMDCPAGLVEL